MKTVLATILALMAFAANSVLCRLALLDKQIDASSFTIIRLLSGAMILCVLFFIGSAWGRTRQVAKPKVTVSKPKAMVSGDGQSAKGSWPAAFFLFIYALTFSYAYLSLDTGVGALILFTAVQFTIILVGVMQGEKLIKAEWLGFAIAFVGFVYLLMPDLTLSSSSYSLSMAPFSSEALSKGASAMQIPIIAFDLFGVLLMLVAGVSWGAYTLSGKHSVNPLSDTSYNFLRTIPLVIVFAIVVLTWQSLSNQPFGFITMKGWVLAVLSGGLASGVGYFIWYIALSHLTRVKAAVVQLSVPVIAAVGGVLFAGESFSLPLLIASLVILGGILVVLLGKTLFKDRY